MSLGNSSEYCACTSLQSPPEPRHLPSYVGMPGVGMLRCQQVQTSVDEDALRVTHAVLEVMLKDQVEQKKKYTSSFNLLDWKHAGSVMQLES